VRYTASARRDVTRLYQFLLERDINTAEKALAALERGTDLLRDFPFSCRKAVTENPLLREMLIPFAGSGYVVLFEIENNTTVTILAIRHQREDDYFS